MFAVSIRGEIAESSPEVTVGTRCGQSEIDSRPDYSWGTPEGREVMCHATLSQPENQTETRHTVNHQPAS